MAVWPPEVIDPPAGAPTRFANAGLGLNASNEFEELLLQFASALGSEICC